MIFSLRNQIFKNALFLDHQCGKKVPNPTPRKCFGPRIFFRRLELHQRVGEAEVVVADVAELCDEARDHDVVDFRPSGRSSSSLHSKTSEEEAEEQFHIVRRLKVLEHSAFLIVRLLWSLSRCAFTICANIKQFLPQQHRSCNNDKSLARALVLCENKPIQ